MPTDICVMSGDGLTSVVVSRLCQAQLFHFMRVLRVMIDDLLARVICLLYFKHHTHLMYLLSQMKPGHLCLTASCWLKMLLMRTALNAMHRAGMTIQMLLMNAK